MQVEITKKHYRAFLGLFVIFMLASLYMSLPFLLVEKMNLIKALGHGMLIISGVIGCFGLLQLFFQFMRWCFDNKI